MLVRLGQWADLVVRVVAYTGLILFPALVVVTMYEVAARYIYNAPTIWSFDITFMLHGVLFMVSGGYALQKSAHVRIDVLSTRFPIRVQHAVNFLAYVFLLLPGLGIAADATLRRTLSSFATNEVELVSAWGPYVWPFFTGLSIGLVVLWLQAFVEATRHLGGIFSAKPMPSSEESA